MSKKKHYDTKVELFQELKEHLEDLYNQIEAAEVRYTHLEHQDYISLVVNPFNELLENVELFTTNLDNGIYDSSGIGDDLEENYED